MNRSTRIHRYGRIVIKTWGRSEGRHLFTSGNWCYEKVTLTFLYRYCELTLFVQHCFLHVTIFKYRSSCLVLNCLILLVFYETGLERMLQVHLSCLAKRFSRGGSYDCFEKGVYEVERCRSNRAAFGRSLSCLQGPFPGKGP